MRRRDCYRSGFAVVSSKFTRVSESAPPRSFFRVAFEADSLALLMQQLLQSLHNGDTGLMDVPCPLAGAGQVLIRGLWQRRWMRCRAPGRWWRGSPGRFCCRFPAIWRAGLEAKAMEKAAGG